MKSWQMAPCVVSVSRSFSSLPLLLNALIIHPPLARTAKPGMFLSAAPRLRGWLLKARKAGAQADRVGARCQPPSHLALPLPSPRPSLARWLPGVFRWG